MSGREIDWTTFSPRLRRRCRLADLHPIGSVVSRHFTFGLSQCAIFFFYQLLSSQLVQKKIQALKDLPKTDLFTPETFHLNK